MDKANYTTTQGIRIYDGTTPESVTKHWEKKRYLEQLEYDNELFTDLTPSTLTAQGKMSNVQFDEKEIIGMLSPPTKGILKIGCNYGEMFHEDYKHPQVKKTSGRGRKPKPKVKARRKVQGNGKYFISQITFVIEHPDSKVQYQIKLFRTGVFQVPGVKDPSMQDLVKPIIILRDYLEDNFSTGVEVVDFFSVMRNYKCRLVNENYHVNLDKLEEIILNEKINHEHEDFLNKVLRFYPDNAAETIKELSGNYNPWGISEITYNPDRCFCLIIKFNRPSIIDREKKTTVKLLKRGKINFDGGNSQNEIIELYMWLRHLYTIHKDEILTDVRSIRNVTPDTSSCDESSIYDQSNNTTDIDEIEIEQRELSSSTSLIDLIASEIG